MVEEDIRKMVEVSFPLIIVMKAELIDLPYAVPVRHNILIPRELESSLYCAIRIVRIIGDELDRPNDLLPAPNPLPR